MREALTVRKFLLVRVLWLMQYIKIRIRMQANYRLGKSSESRSTRREPSNSCLGILQQMANTHGEKVRGPS